MVQIISYKLSYKDIQIKNTLQKRNILLEEGYEEISVDEFEKKLSQLGYKINKSDCFNYYNDLNEDHYLARAMAYIDIKTKQSYAHYQQSISNFENLEKLQKIRKHYFVFENNTIWEL